MDSDKILQKLSYQMIKGQRDVADSLWAFSSSQHHLREGEISS